MYGSNTFSGPISKRGYWMKIVEDKNAVIFSLYPTIQKYCTVLLYDLSTVNVQCTNIILENNLSCKIFLLSVCTLHNAHTYILRDKTNLYVVLALMWQYETYCLPVHG